MSREKGSDPLPERVRESKASFDEGINQLEVGNGHRAESRGPTIRTRSSARKRLLEVSGWSLS